MRCRLGLPPAAKPAEMSIVVQHGEELYSLTVDEVGEVLSFPAASIAPNPPALDATWRAISRGVIRMEDRLLVIVEVGDLFERADAA
jgi:purine-binding chemotaxis protein CheW